MQLLKKILRVVVEKKFLKVILSAGKSVSFFSGSKSQKISGWENLSNEDFSLGGKFCV